MIDSGLTVFEFRDLGMTCFYFIGTDDRTLIVPDEYWSEADHPPESPSSAVSPKPKTHAPPTRATPPKTPLSEASLLRRRTVLDLFLASRPARSARLEVALGSKVERISYSTCHQEI